MCLHTGENTMSSLTKEIVAPISLDYYIKIKHYTQANLADKIGVDQSTLSHWRKRDVTITDRKFNLLLNFLSHNIGLDDSKEFCNFLISKLAYEGYDTTICQLILDEHTNIKERLEKLIKRYESTSPQLQYVLDIPSIILKIKNLCLQYKHSITFNDQQLIQDNSKPSYSNWVYGFNDTNDSNLVTKQNYLILNFPNNYRVALILTNHSFNDILATADSVTTFKEKNHIQLIVIFTDNEISFAHQKYFMENHNLFFETVNNEDLNKVTISSVRMHEILTEEDSVKAYFYAQVVFERLTSYFSVIRDEIVFRNFNHTRTSRTENTISSNSTNLLEDFASKILLKDIYKYSYLARHSIYFERTRLNEYIKRNKKILGTVVEIGFSNSFISSCIYKNCKNLILFTNSHHSLKSIKKLIDESEHKIFPDTMQFHMMHINPQYISHQYADDLIGKVDLVILGFGKGSSTNNLTEYLRHINSWLSPTGILFISLENEESVMIRKPLNYLYSPDTIPLQTSEQWKYSNPKPLELGLPAKKYRIEAVKKIISTHVDIQSIYTYPFLSALMNTSELENNLRDEVREADKYFAQKQIGRHGHYISIIGEKNHKTDTSVITPEKRSKKIQSLIYTYLNREHIEYEIIDHSVAIDTQSLYKALLENNIDSNDFDLVKTMVLQTDNRENPKYKYIVAPKEHKFKISKSKESLLTEKEVTEIFNTGSISPLVTLHNVMEYTQLHGSVCLLGLETLTKEYVIISSGYNTQSIKLKKSTFINLIQKMLK